MTQVIKFSCACGKRISAPPSQAGKAGKCPKCGEPIRVPDAPAAEPPPPPPEPKAEVEPAPQAAKPALDEVVVRKATNFDWEGKLEPREASQPWQFDVNAMTDGQRFALYGIGFLLMIVIAAGTYFLTMSVVG